MLLVPYSITENVFNIIVLKITIIIQIFGASFMKYLRFKLKSL